jgi:hypothetical protein
MSEIVNLRRARKDKARADKESQAAANRAKYGQTKADKTRDAAVTALERRRIDQAKLDREEK